VVCAFKLLIFENKRNDDRSRNIDGVQTYERLNENDTDHNDDDFEFIEEVS
jgi:hypothetical protein